MPNIDINRNIVLNRDLEQETIVYNSYLTTKLTTHRLWIVDNLVKSLKSSGNWSKLDRLWLLASETQQAARISLVNPSSTAATAVNSPTWVANQGYTSDGATSYVNCNYNPTTHGVNFNQDSAGVFVYSRTNQTDGLIYEIGCNDAGQTIFLGILTKNTGDLCVGLVNDAASTLSVANTNSQGFYSAIRTGANTTEMFKNGASIDTGTDASVGINNLSVYVCARNAASVAFSFSSKQISIAGFSGSNLNQSAFYNSIQAYMTSIGSQV